MTTNPYASIAIKDDDNPYTKIAIQGEQQPAPSPAPEPSTLSKIGNFGKDIAKGLGESAVSLMSTGDKAVRKIPGGIGEFLTTPITGTPADKAIQHTQELATPANTTQAVSKGIGQAAQFLIPGGAEEKAASMLPAAARGIGKIGISALSSGLVNKAQGGDFGTGAAAGGIGAGIGQGLRAIAPKIAEGALGINKVDRAFGKTPGEAILKETSGIRPSSIAESGQARLNQLNPEVNRLADAASVKPNAPRGLLTSGTQEIPLHSSPDVRGRLSKPITIEGNRPMPREFPSYGVNQSQPAHVLGDIPGEAGPIPDEPGPSDRFNGFRAHEYQGQIPGTRGGAGQPQGVLRRPPTIEGGPVPEQLPNPVASLRGARSGLAATQGQHLNAPSLYDQLGEMRNNLSLRQRGPLAGQEIPENVTPRDLLDLQRDFSHEFLGRWNPETHGVTLGAGRRAYGALGNEFDRTAGPEAAGLRQRVSSLIPVVRRAESVSRDAGIPQQIFRRFAAPTGALAGSIGGGALGYREGGIKGAGLGALAGAVGGPLLASPEGWMAAARIANKANGLRLPVGIGLQANRNKEEK